MKAEGSYALVFCVTFVLVSALTLVCCKIFDDSADVVVNASTAAPPFPDAYPQLPFAATAPAQPSQCINYCTNPNTGKVEPCYTTKLTACTKKDDCDVCHYALPYQRIECQEASTWSGVAENQAKLDNSADSYCLPKKESCIFVPPDMNGNVTPMQCGSDDDCIRCSDTLPAGERFTCQTVAPNTNLTLANAGGQVQEFIGVPGGKFCMPESRGCDPKYGSALWTSTEGWKCVCKYPSVFAGDMCNEPVACRVKELYEGTKSKQQLLQNMPGADGSKVGDVWTFDSGIDPNKCVDASNNQVERLSNGECPHGTQPTAACQCDGIQEGTRATYRYNSSNPLTCDLDPCYANVNGGRTADDPSSLPKIPYQPATTCACSGAGSRLWDYTAANTEELAASNGYTWIGHCKDKRIPNTNIVIKATPSPLCDAQPNQEANVSGLVPGPRPPLSEQVTTAPTVDGCIADPCAGNYSDPLYRTTQSIGYFDATKGVCACFKQGQPVQPMFADDFPDCDRTANPVCSSCQDACQGGTLDELCPVFQSGANLNACGNRRCATAPDGTKTCDCGTDCFYYSGMCYPKVASMQSCEGMAGVANVCVEPNEKCQRVNSYEWPYCDPGEPANVDRHVICYDQSYCGQVTCKGGFQMEGFVPVFGANFMNKWEPCGGSSQVRFTDEGLNVLPASSSCHWETEACDLPTSP